MQSLGASSQVDTSNLKLSMKEINERINYRRRYIIACISPTLVLLVGVALYYYAIREPIPVEEEVYGIDVNGIVDGIYWAMITMTTIGYGDICPETPWAKTLAILYLPVAVMALADAVADIQMIGLRRSIRETDFGKTADECLLRDATRDDENENLEPELTEAEFLIDQLCNNGLVDMDAVIAIRRQFAYLTRRSTAATETEKKLTPELVFEEIRDRVEKGEPVSLGAEMVDVMMIAPTTARGVEKAAFRWKNYREWKYNSWQVRVKAKAADLKAIKANGGVRKGQSDGLNANSFRMM